MSRPSVFSLILASAGAAALAASGLASAGSSHAGFPMFGGHPAARPPVTVVAPIHPGGSNLGHTIIRPAVPPVFFNPVVPGFVSVAPPVVIVVPAPVHVPGPAVITTPGTASVQPMPPTIAPSSPIFFAPPVTHFPAQTGGQVLIIRRVPH